MKFRIRTGSECTQEIKRSTRLRQSRLIERQTQWGRAAENEEYRFVTPAAAYRDESVAVCERRHCPAFCLLITAARYSVETWASASFSPRIRKMPSGIRLRSWAVPRHRAGRFRRSCLLILLGFG